MKCYNLFRGLQVKPVKGEWSQMRRHIRWAICRGNETLFRYVMTWLARSVQKPGGLRPGVALVLLGKQGTGKGVFMRYVGKLFGVHYLHITSSEQLTGRFNFHFKACLMCFSDEGMWGGSKSAEGVLKGLITEDTLFCEPKGKDGFTVANHVNLVIASNNPWVIPAGLEERRYCVLDVSEAHMQDTAYFAAICHEMDSGGLEAMMYDLLHLDLSQVDLRKPPRTEALFGQILQTMPSATKFWYQLLVDGQFPSVRAEFGKLIVEGNLTEEWPAWYETHLLHFAYVEFSRSLNDRYPLSREVFTKELQKLCPLLKSCRKSNAFGRSSGIAVPPLDVCRKAFSEAVKFNLEWVVESPKATEMSTPLTSLDPQTFEFSDLAAESTIGTGLPCVKVVLS